jgi:endonuclease/exonuclease/phosphatase family metal-dependent hydrolase
MWLFLLLTFLAVTLAQTNNTNCECATPLSVASYNILQIPFAPYREVRFTATIQFLQQNTFDVLCIQELFDSDQRQRFISELNSVYPHIVEPGPPATDNCSSPCSDSDANQILSCMSGNQCLLENNFVALACLLDYCSDTLDNISNSCTDCVFGFDFVHLGLSDKMEKCAGQRRIMVNIDGNQQEAYDACNYLFDEETDTLILSKYPILQSDIYRYDVSPFFYNTALYAEINVPTIGSVHTFCTHTAADIPFSNNENANYAQIQELVRWIDSKVPANATVIAAGDFNMVLFSLSSKI